MQNDTLKKDNDELQTRINAFLDSGANSHRGAVTSQSNAKIGEIL